MNAFHWSLAFGWLAAFFCMATFGVAVTANVNDRGDLGRLALILLGCAALCAFLAAGLSR